MEEEEPRDSEVLLVLRVVLVSPSPAPLPLGPCTETWAWLESPEALGYQESPVCLVSLDVLVQRVVLGQWVGWADLARLVPLVLLVILGLLGSLDRLESKVSPVQQGALDPLVQWDAATASGTRW